MGRLKKGYNWKARNSGGNNSSPVVNEKDAVQLDLDVKQEQYDASNALVLPSKKKKKNKVQGGKIEHMKEKKPLSKKERKRLEKILEKKKKKINRAELLDKLSQVQATPSELEHMTSTSMMQTFGLKRYSSALKMGENGKGIKIRNVKGAKRKRRDSSSQNESKQDDMHDEEGSSSDDDEDEGKVGETENSQPSMDVTSSVSCDSVEQDSVQKTSSCDQRASEKNTVAITEAKQEVPAVQGEKKSEPAVFVPVNRLPEIQAAREKLPIYSEEQAIMEAINENSVVIIHGATGSGKTTQIPQFLYEAGYTKNGKLIAITEPRRIAAVSMAERVGKELNLPDVVSYHIRYERTTSQQTEIKFMTDGVLLKEIKHNFLLSRYSVIVVDEAHERSVFSDVVIGLLSRILNLREKKGNPLKVVIMSATLRVKDFTENRNLFKQEPLVIEIPSRQYDVALHFNKKTPEDYLEAAYKKVCKIHRQLPAGGILVFVTGEQEVNSLCKKLSKTFPFPKKGEANESSNNPPRTLGRKRKKLNKDESSVTKLPAVDLDTYSAEPVSAKSSSNNPSDESENEECEAESFQPLHVLPLYSILSTKEQAKIFESPPEGSRLCVVATNIAETSVTIPGLKYVVDTGRTKTRVYDQTCAGMSQFVITWTSKASANQRAGRAGRTEGGHCYRLYSSAVFDNDFPSYTLPDIQRTPVDDIVLQMKALGIVRVVNFPFPSAPDVEALKSTEKRLMMLGALEDSQKGQRFKDIRRWEFTAKITPLGEAMSRFPVNPRYAKMLLLSHQHQVISHVITLVSALTVPELFVSSTVPSETEDGNSQEKRQWHGIRKIGAGSGKSLKLGDPMVLLRAIGMYNSSQRKAQFCSTYGVRQKAMIEINKMRVQLTKEMNQCFKDLNVPLPSDSSEETLVPEDDEEIEKLRKLLLIGLVDHVARKVPREELGDQKHKLKNAYKCLDTKEYVFIHPSSILFHEVPEFVIYQEIFKTSKYYMKGVTKIEPQWIPAFFPNLCEFSLPQEIPVPWYDQTTDKIFCCMTSTFGVWDWELPVATLEMPHGLVKYKWFCYFLLEGEISPFFKQFRKYLESPPSHMLKPWANTLRKANFLMNAVVEKEIDSKAALYKVWEENPKYLLIDYLKWLPEDKHSEVLNKWMKAHQTEDSF